MIIKTIKRRIKSNHHLFLLAIFLYNGWNIINLKIFPNDLKFLKRQYKRKTGKLLNVDKPKLFNEKIQLLKINHRPSVLHSLVDKYEVRTFITTQIGDKYLIPLFGLYENYDEIDFEILPKKFILKLTNGSGQNVMIFDKSVINHKKLRSLFYAWQKINHYSIGREWAYKGVENRIIAEKLIVDKNNNIPIDYKILCFHGEPKAIAIYVDRHTKNIKRIIFNTDWIPISNRDYVKNNPDVACRPNNLDEMLNISKILSKGFPFVRVDLYVIDKKIYFGELTFYPKGGYMEFEDEKVNRLLGSYINY